jgi:hypothetical protein
MAVTVIILPMQPVQTKDQSAHLRHLIMVCTACFSVSTYIEMQTDNLLLCHGQVFIKLAI